MNFHAKFKLGEKVIYAGRVMYVSTITCGSDSQKTFVTYRLHSQLPDVYFAGSGELGHMVFEGDLIPYSEEAEAAIAAAEAILKKYGRSP